MRKFLNVSLSAEQLEAVRRLADAQYTSVATIVRQAIARYLEQYDSTIASDCKQDVRVQAEETGTTRSRV